MSDCQRQCEARIACPGGRGGAEGQSGRGVERAMEECYAVPAPTARVGSGAAGVRLAQARAEVGAALQLPRGAYRRPRPARWQSPAPASGGPHAWAPTAHPREELVRNLALWEVRGPDDYWVEFQRSGMCPLKCHMPARITVRDGSEDSVVFTGPALVWGEH